MRRTLLCSACVIVAAIAVGSCGYSLAGRGSFLPAYIKTIGVPAFTNATQSFDVEQILTEQVRAEFVGRGKYEVLPQDTGVDAVLIGEVTGLSVAPTGFNSQQQASRYAATLTAKIEFRDLRANRVLWSNPGMSFREEYEVSTVTSGADPALFFGQNTNALERLAGDFARSVVAAILEAF